MDGYWNVYNRDGEEFKIHVKNGIIPQPDVVHDELRMVGETRRSRYEGEIWCEFREMFCLNRPEMCCPECITIERKSKNNLVMKEYGNAMEIWMRDVNMEERVAERVAERALISSSKFVELMEK